VKIILNGRKAGNGDNACYFKNKACFQKRGLMKRTLLHEVAHALSGANDVSREFESKLTQMTGTISSKALEE
jgi:hypothetical protein